MELQIKTMDTTTLLVGWQQSKILTTPIASEHVELQEFSFIADGNTK